MAYILTDRRRWPLALRIEDYALIGDTQTAALVGIDGSIDWLCLPRFDSAACFAALLGDADNGRWRLAPKGARRASGRRYLERALVLETEWQTATGTVRVLDFMPPRDDLPDVIRLVEGVSGEVEMRMELVLRFDYGRIVPWVRRVGGDVCAVAGPDEVCLRTGAPVKGKGLRTIANFTVRAGEQVPFVLSWHPSHEPPHEPPHAGGALEQTLDYWRGWTGRLRYEGAWKEEVRQSLMVLKALTYAPTGGMVAAPTTSLPEHIGGVRNWDYRFCWLRDAAFTLWALNIGGYTDEVRGWRNWLLRASGGDPDALQVLYGPAGESRLPELTLDWLAGYEASRPVRIGNAAAEQYQLDVYGEVLDALHLSRVFGLEASEESWAMQRHLVNFVVEHWREPDEGIWEVRGPRRQFTHSKVLAWVALDRAVKAVEKFGLSGPVERWRQVRQEIHDDVCRQGYDSKRNTFTQYYGSEALDASLLMIPLLHFLPATDRRMRGTVEAIERELMQDGFVLRYRTEETDDGLPTGEGAFLACTFWLVDNLALLGRLDEAERLFERLLGLRNDVGLLAEEYDPRRRRLLGNFPQAFSHVGLVNAAYNLDRARRARARAVKTM
ncbi:MAG TPA: glycoside hydrolase family 15 protein [Candidatus Limnocylindria bacterium]|nr:glycoside hydrolase family 15 protein [Candidatus Limnocylindria bacterium]